MRQPRVSVNRRALLRGLKRQEQAAAVREHPAYAWTDRLRASRPGMGSFFEVQLPAILPGALFLAESMLDQVERLEAQLTIYRDDSELSRLNARAHERPVAVEPRLFALLAQALELSNETHGAYDVASGALSLAWGFVKGPRRVPDAAVLETARARSGFRLVELNQRDQTVTFLRAGLVLNLGSIGKGYAVDRAIELARAYRWPAPALVQSGQSSVFALGEAPGQLTGGWPVSLRNPFDADRPLGTIRLKDRGLGTSGLAYQAFEAGGKRYGHILDPRTGKPAERGPASVTVLAPTAAQADALSTAFYLIGPRETAAYVSRHPEVSAIFVVQADGSTAGQDGAMVELLTINLSPSEFACDLTVPVREVSLPQTTPCSY